MATGQEYDYIIVGGGTAGLVVANRLSADPDTQVLVLEAGEDRLTDPQGLTPALWQSQLGTTVDWNFATTSQAGLNNRSISQPQGRVLGGSSAINGLAFIPPSQAGIDEWGKLGNEGWSWSTLEPYYTKFRKLAYPSDPETFARLGFHEYPRAQQGNGPLHASFPDALDDPMPSAWVESFKELGWTPKADVFSGHIQGGFTCASSIDVDTKTRTHSGIAYYLPARDRSNLKVQTNAVVEKMILKKLGQDFVVQGVKWQVNGETHEAQARKEVILAAGVYGTPRLLELSGIGCKDVLEPLGIEVIVESPNVGKNLQDHLMTGISFEVKDGVKTLDDLRRMVPEALQAAAAAYATNRTGPFAIAGTAPSLSCQCCNSELEELLSRHPSVIDGKQPVQQEYYKFTASTLSSDQDGSAAFWLAPAFGSFGNESTLSTSDVPGNFITIGVTHLHPFSRGSSHIATRDPTAKPTINPEYLQHPLDVEIFARHLTFIETLARSGPLGGLIKDPVNGRRNNPLAKANNLQEARAYARVGTISNWHPVGTAVMLPRDKGGVFGSDLKVHGVKNLRIVDSSIMPVITRGNPQTTVYAVAERAADIILGNV
ncbi:GMC oxidoreductase [Periconia macrospinosa]|uniref:GMC oxidoreductase n=1 Tax=Periconia macrospinosa TaxID=97972 RepID=A0A2V1DFC2_9PLEO|nr:GMC oxidoreductase [Periconia macrospinosa]